MASKSIRRFLGIRRDAEGYLADRGEAWTEQNLSARQGSLVKRLGFRRITASVQPLGYASWPNLLYSFGGESDGDDDMMIAPPTEPEGGGSEEDETPSAAGAPGGGGGLSPVMDEAGDPVVDPVTAPGTDSLPPSPPWPDPEEPAPEIFPTLPGTVYGDCLFALGLVATAPDYAGAGAAVVAYAVNTAGARPVATAAALKLAGGSAPNPTTGWTEGNWTANVYAGLSAADVLWVQATVNGEYPHATWCALARPTFAVSLPIAATYTAFDLAVECNQANYRGAGGGLALFVEGYVEGTEEWEATSALKTAAGGAINFAAGWVGGEWEDSVRLESDAYTKLRVTVRYGTEGLGSATADIDEFGLGSIAVALPASIEINTPFTMTLTARLNGGATKTDYDGAGAGLKYEAKLYGSAEYSAGPTATLADGSAIDLATGWVNGVWSASVKAAGFSPGDWWQYKVTSLINDVDSLYDEAYMDIEAPTTLNKAIQERCLAVGADAPDLAGTYTFEQLQAYVNGACSRPQQYLADNAWNGGVTTYPDYLDNTYANGAATKEDLWPLVLAMQRTACDLQASGAHDGGSGSGQSEDSAAAAIAAARADYELDGGDGGTGGRTSLSYNAGGTGGEDFWSAYVVLTARQYETVALSTSTAKAVRFYWRTGEYGVSPYSDLGKLGGAGLDDFVFFGETAAATEDSVVASPGYTFDVASPPAAGYWPALGAGYDAKSQGFAGGGHWVGVVIWSFYY
jgi:hypothetical protein